MQLSTDRHPAPTALLAEPRRNRTTSAAQLKRTLDTWDLRPLTGGRHNEVYSWAGPHGETTQARLATSSPGETPTW